MTELLPLSESSFRALEDAYVEQRSHAQLLQRQHAVSNKSEEGVGRLACSADAAAAVMQQLLVETRQLHERFVHLKSNAGASFTEDELRRLSRLGFDVSALPLPSISRSGDENQKQEGRGQPQPVVAASCKTSGCSNGEAAALKLENAQLLSALAWYRFREGAAAPLPSDPSLTIRDSASCCSPLPTTSSALLKKLEATRALSKSLCDAHAARAQVKLPPGAQPTAVDVAIDELLQRYHFPPQVLVERIALTQLYMLDRPVIISFVSPQSSTLVVQDPDGVEADSDLSAYLLQLYKPLLRALNWSPPSIPQLALSQMTNAELVELKRTKLQ